MKRTMIKSMRSMLQLDPT